MRTGAWMDRLDDVRETEDMLMHMDTSTVPGIATPDK